MRTKQEITFDIDMVIREMAQIVIKQSADDERLSMLDRRRTYLEKELAARLAGEVC